MGSRTRELDALCSSALGTGPELSVPAWARDGSALAAFTGPLEVCVQTGHALWWSWSCSASDASSVIYDYELASADREALYTTPPGMHAENPDWSPDGSRLLFDAYPPTGSRRVRRIFAVSLSDGELRQLVPEAANPAVVPYHDHDAVWSPVTR